MQGLHSQRWSNIKLTFLTGVSAKQPTAQTKLHAAFSVICLGNQHVHMLDQKHNLAQLARPGGLLLVETAKNTLQLSKQQVMRHSACSHISLLRGQHH